MSLFNYLYCRFWFRTLIVKTFKFRVFAPCVPQVTFITILWNYVLQMQILWHFPNNNELNWLGWTSGTLHLKVLPCIIQYTIFRTIFLNCSDVIGSSLCKLWLELVAAYIVTTILKICLALYIKEEHTYNLWHR